MTRALVIILFVVGFALAAWALLGAPQIARTADQSANAPAAGQAPPAAANPAPADQAAQPNAGAAPQAGATQPNAGAAPQAGAAQPSGAAGDQAAAGGGGNPQDIAKSAEKGSLKSPYQDFKQVAEEGHQKFMGAGCNGCHGGTGGGGMGPPLTNQVWVYGSDDDTLFRLISLGSDELKKQGYNRKGSENVVGPMPPMGGVLKDPDSVWKVIAWIRSINPSALSRASRAMRSEHGVLDRRVNPAMT
jgi:mono/diheme cytochrome c family protein